MIHQLADLKGKTIASVEHTDDLMMITTKCGLTVVMQALIGYGDLELKSIDPTKLDTFDQWQLGIISKKEYTRLQKNKTQQRCRERKRREIQQLADLKAKYEGDPS